ncbi:MAG TPA: hypothetical protein VIF40_13230 [Methylosinus sp.]|jgi:hypothetical protein|uniref:hypothetical protein n=1 Tax=Methylosinus sp. TaxID=427 RepID=UPI002F954EA2
MEVRKELQLNPVGDEVLALTAVVRPILSGVLYGLKHEIAAEAGGFENIKLKMLPRLYRPGDGDVGICFEYAVHDAMNNGDSRVLERISDAIKLCRIKTLAPRSILFGIEKTGAIQLIDTAKNILTDESRVLAGIQGQPAKLRPRLNILAAAFKRPTSRLALPWSIRGLWKADLFVGSINSQQWVGTSVKINPAQLEGAAGLRIGIVPIRAGRTDKIRLDEGKKLVICPLHHDQDFMQIFYEGWRIVQAFIEADAQVPKEVYLPRPIDREVCKILMERRDFPVVDVVDALRIFSQPELLETATDTVALEDLAGDPTISTMVAPISRLAD